MSFIVPLKFVTAMRDIGSDRFVLNNYRLETKATKRPVRAGTMDLMWLFCNGYIEWTDGTVGLSALGEHEVYLDRLKCGDIGDEDTGS